MNHEELTRKLESVLQIGFETEVVEFKEAKTSFDSNKLGEYFSALCNEASLMRKEDAWLIFGIRDKDHSIVGTQFRSSAHDLHHLKEEIAQHATNQISFVEIYELRHQNKRVVLFQIPKAPQGIPVAWKGHYYGRAGESLQALSLSELERIRNQNSKVDWSRTICHQASIRDLSPEALLKARELYTKKLPKLATEIASWTDDVFLNKAKLTINGQMTATAILLLGLPEADHYLSPGQAKISWILKDQNGIEQDYEHFGCPFLLNTEKAYQKIRNLKYRYLSEGSLFPEEVDSYDPYVIREALHNCIAHQNYTLGGVIRLVENENRTLTFLNKGGFIPGSIEKVIHSDAPESEYRNPFLTNAMVNLGMIDTIGSGIRRMFNSQRQRFFPMPEYTIRANEVQVLIEGKVLDLNYARKLASIPDLGLEDVYLLDKLQKGQLLSATQADHLKKKGLVEGRRPNVHISSSIALASGQNTEYMNLRGIDNEFCKTLILDYLKRFKKANRKVLEALLLKKLPSGLDEVQKKNKIKNALQSLKSAGQILPEGKSWVLSNAKY